MSLYDQYINPFLTKAKKEVKSGLESLGEIDEFLNGNADTTRDENSGQRVIPLTEKKVLPPTEEANKGQLISGLSINWQAISGIVAVLTLVLLVLRRK